MIRSEGTDELGSKVMKLRARFEKATSARIATPQDYKRAQKEVAAHEAKQIMLARKKASAFNMSIAVNQIRKKKVERRESERRASKQVEEMKSTDDAQAAPKDEDEHREFLRAKARRVSTTLRQFDTNEESVGLKVRVVFVNVMEFQEECVDSRVEYMHIQEWC